MVQTTEMDFSQFWNLGSSRLRCHQKVYSGASSLGLQRAIVSLCAFTTFPVCTPHGRERGEATGQLDSGPILNTSFILSLISF